MASSSMTGSFHSGQQRTPWAYWGPRQGDRPSDQCIFSRFPGNSSRFLQVGVIGFVGFSETLPIARCLLICFWDQVHFEKCNSDPERFLGKGFRSQAERFPCRFFPKWAREWIVGAQWLSSLYRHCLCQQSWPFEVHRTNDLDSRNQ